VERLLQDTQDMDALNNKMVRKELGDE